MVQFCCPWDILDNDVPTVTAESPHKQRHMLLDVNESATQHLENGFLRYHLPPQHQVLIA